MKQALVLLLAAAIGSAVTYLAMKPAPPAATTPAAAGKPFPTGFGDLGQPANAGATPPGENPRPLANQKYGKKGGGFLPEEIEGVSAEQLAQCKVAMMKAFQDEGVREARAKVNELRKEAEYASDDEKRNLRPQFEEAAAEIRKATKAALLAADAELTEPTVDKVLDALEERMRQFQQGKKK